MVGRPHGWIPLLVGVTLLGLGCRTDLRGKPCVEDAQCGPGYDCFRKECIAVCTEDTECIEGERCYRHHCIADITSEKPAASVKVATKASVPPVPDPKVAELRALRRQVEQLRRGQQEILRLLRGRNTAPNGGTRTPTPVLPGTSP